MKKDVKSLLASIDAAIGVDAVSYGNVKIKFSNKNYIKKFSKAFKEASKIPTAGKILKYAKSKNIKLTRKEAKNIASGAGTLADAKKYVRGIKKKQEISNLNKSIRNLKKKYNNLKDKGKDAEAHQIAKEIKSLEIHKKNYQLQEYKKQQKKALKEGNIQKANELDTKVRDIMNKKEILKVKKAEDVASWSSEKAPSAIENWILDNYRKEFNELRKQGKSWDEAFDILIKKAIVQGKLQEGKHNKKNGHFGYIDESGDVWSPR